MFFDLQLLREQSGGDFPFVWIAATRGVKLITKKTLLDINVIKVCEKIMEFIITESRKPKNRLSLVLAAKLVHGTARIYSRQIIILYNDISEFLCQVHAPIIVEELKLSPEDLTPVVRERKKRKKPQILSQNGEIQNVPIEEQEIPEKRPAHSRKFSVPELETFGIAVPVQGLLEAPNFPDTTVHFPEPVLQTMEVQADVHQAEPIEQQIEPPSKRARTEMEPTEKSQVEQQIPPEKESTQMILQVPEETFQSPEGNLLELVKTVSQQTTVIEEKDSEEIVSRFIKAPKGTLQLKRKANRIINLNKNDIESFFEYVHKDRFPIVYNKSLFEVQQGYEFARPFLHISGARDIMRHADTRSKSSAESLTLRKSKSRVSRHTPAYLETKKTSSIDLVQSTDSILDTGKQMQQQSPQLVPDEPVKIPQDIEEIGIQQVTIVEELAPAGRVRTRSPERILSLEKHTGPPIQPPLPEGQGIKRKNIFQKILKWDFIQAELYLEDLIEPPLTKLKVAKSFYNLLSLAKSGYVVLHNLPGSIEIGKIEKGPKLDLL